MSQSNPRAQVPGYCGYIPGKNSENKFGGTFGQITKGAYPTQKESFLTTNIGNNTHIQQQYQSDDRFWGNSGKLSAFNPNDREPKKHNDRVEAASTVCRI